MGLETLLGASTGHVSSHHTVDATCMAVMLDKNSFCQCKEARSFSELMASAYSNGLFW